MKKIVIATRGSALALWQAEHVRARLEARAAELGRELTVELLVLKTKGDVILDVPLAKVGGKGLFVKEIEEALLSGAADLAVHSMKDVPMELPAGLILGAVPEREVHTDLFLSERYPSLDALPREPFWGPAACGGRLRFWTCAAICGSPCCAAMSKPVCARCARGSMTLSFWPRQGSNAWG